MYTFGSAGTCSTDLANKRAFERYQLVPRMLVDATNRSIEASALLTSEDTANNSYYFLILSDSHFRG